jgi:hypothetical protein
MGDEGPRHAEHPRVSGERPVGQFRQLPVVAGRQIVANPTDLLFNEVVVVEQPLGRGRDGAPLVNRARDRAIRVEQDRFVVPQPRGERAAPRRRGGDRLGGSEARGMGLETLDAEELLADEVFGIPGRGGRPPSEGSEDWGDEAPRNSPPARPHRQKHVSDRHHIGWNRRSAGK